MAAEEVWQRRQKGCERCSEASDKLSCYYNMTSRMLSMLWHRERDTAVKLSKMENAIEDMEGERRGLLEERDRLRREVKELRQRKPAQGGVDASTSMGRIEEMGSGSGDWRSWSRRRRWLTP